MRWLPRPWRRIADRVPEPTLPPMPAVTSLQEAEMARRESERTLAEATQRSSTVDRVSESLRKARRRNHFSDLIIDALGVHRT